MYLSLLFTLAVLLSGARSQNNNNNNNNDNRRQNGNTAFDSNFNAPTQQEVRVLPPAEEQKNDDIPPETTEVPVEPPRPQNTDVRDPPQPPRDAIVKPAVLPPPRDTAICNPVTGIRAANGGIYAGLLQRLGVQAGNCGQQIPRGGNQGRYGRYQGRGARDQGGLVNPITGFRAQRGGIYETVLNAAGVRGNQAGGGLFGNNALVQAINARGGLLAVGDENSALPASSAQAPMPGWAIAGIVVLSVVMVATVAVMIQLVYLVRRS